MNRHYSGITSAAQRAIETVGGSAVYPSLDTIYPLLEQHGIWTVGYPEGTTQEECYYWVWLHANVLARQEQGRRTGILYTLPTGVKLLETLRPEGEPAQLLLITEEDEQKYMLSKKRDFLAEEYPEITSTEVGKEVLVPGWRRLAGGSIFIDGYGAGRPGFESLFVFFVYHLPDRTHAIYFLSTEERHDPEKRYIHLHLAMKDTEYNSLDANLKEYYGIDNVGNSVA